MADLAISHKLVVYEEIEARINALEIEHIILTRVEFFNEKLFGATRNEVMTKLAEEGIGARKYFYPLTNSFDAFHGKYDISETPVALYMSKRVLTLPLYADLPLDVVEKICKIILSCKG